MGHALTTDEHRWLYHLIYIGAVPLQKQDTRSEKRRAFIAEDAPDVRESLVVLLQHEGFAIVGTAATEFQAINWLLQNERGWDLAIVDLLLQDGSGFNVVRHFKNSHAAGKVLVYSGFVTDVIREQCQKLGAEAVISKTDIQQLQRVLETFRPKGGTTPP